MIIFFWHCHAVSGPPGGVSRVKSGLRGRWDRPVVRVLRREVMYCKTTSKPHAKLLSHKSQKFCFDHLTPRIPLLLLPPTSISQLGEKHQKKKCQSDLISRGTKLNKQMICSLSCRQNVTQKHGSG